MSMGGKEDSVIIIGFCLMKIIIHLYGSVLSVTEFLRDKIETDYIISKWYPAKTEK